MRKGCARRLGLPISPQFFGDQISFRVKGLRRTTLEIVILPQFLAIEPFRAKGSRGTTWKSQFCLSFGDQTSFRAKALLGTDIPSRLALPLPPQRIEEGEGSDDFVTDWTMYRSFTSSLLRPLNLQAAMYALINQLSLVTAIERVGRPGGSHEGVGRKK